jgi:alkanesulfonate monooxygenase SsuD/methylene tetrahydromethanopterin reductase-like flavin-dependent oxidoreductase (luciferase family)
MKIGLVLIIAERKELKRAFSYQETREIAQRAESTGFDSLWLYDHMLYRSEGEPTIGIWECWTFLSALADATQHVELGTLVACNSFRNPALLAKMAITLDEVSQGRLILGIGAGWNKPEYDAFGWPFDHRVSRFEEALQIIRPLLKGGKVDFEGKYYQAHDCEIKPYGPRAGGPPLMIGSFGERMLSLTVKYADLWNTLPKPDTLVQPRSWWKPAVGRARPGQLGVTLHARTPDMAPEPDGLTTPSVARRKKSPGNVKYEKAGRHECHFIRN